MPTPGHILLLGVSIALFAVGGTLSLSRIWWNRPILWTGALLAGWSGVAVGLGLVIWRAVERNVVIPLDHNFDALVMLALVMAGFVLYVQMTRPIGALDWFLMPFVVVLLIGAGVFGKTLPHEYDVRSLWTVTHLVSNYAGLAAFVVAGSAGAMYLIVHRRLRRKNAPTMPGLGNLERLEQVTRLAATLGFALLTVGLLTGVARIWEFGGNTQLGAGWLKSPKVILTLSVWLVYAVVLHAPINPRFRGRRSAILSVAGLILILGTLLAVQLMPEP